MVVGGVLVVFGGYGYGYGVGGGGILGRYGDDDDKVDKDSMKILWLSDECL